MSRIGESSDDQRIREMQEADFRRKSEEKARSEKKGREVAFTEVMAQKLSRTEGEKTARKQAETQTTGEQGREKQAQAKLQNELPQNAAEIARRAAMSRALHSGLVKSTNTAIRANKSAESERISQLEVHARDEREKVERDVRSDDLSEARKADEKSERRVDPDGAGQGRSEMPRSTGGGTSGDRRDGSAAVAAASGARGANATQLPPELVERIAQSIAVALARDGRTEIHVELKGDMLEGVTLKVAARKGKVHCTFEGCDKQMKNLIESSRGDLMRALSKRGLELDILRVRS